MNPVWITQSNLGIYAINHSFNEVPITLQYTADNTVTVALISGTLPIGVTAVYYPGNVRLVGEVDPIAIPETYSFTYRVTNIDGSYADQKFFMELVKNPVPVWLAASQLAPQSETHSFTLYPVYLPFSADSAATVTVLNGVFPPGLVWQKIGNNIVITGESVNLSETTDYQWTYRITNPNGTVSDRTFYITIIPIAEFPDWSGQDSFLGYVGSNKTGSFVVSASTNSNIPLVYALVGTIPAGLTIDPTSGTVNYIAPTVVVDQTIAFTVRASSLVASSDVNLTIIALYAPQPPVWVTPNTLVQVPQESYLQFPLNAYDPLESTITYSIVSAPADFPFLIDTDGLLYGDAPTVTSNTQWIVYILATSPSGATVKDFTIEVTKVNEEGVLVWINNQTAYLNVFDGRQAVYNIGATSTRTPTVKHGITGGQCPPGLVLDKLQGKLVGYVDYHPVDKDYWFDITATDNIDTVTRTIHMKVVSRYGYQYSSVSIPLTGDIKQRWLTSVQYIVTNPDSIPNVNVFGNSLEYPALSVIRGLDSTIKDPDEILGSIWPSLNRLRLSVGSANVTVYDEHNNIMLYRNIIDPQNNSAYVADHSNGYPPTIRPPSIEGLRTALVNSCGYANSGVGTGASAVATINPENGSIASVKIISTGQGYTNRPYVTVSGSGRGANLRSILNVVGLDVIDSGRGWVAGERIILNIGEYTTPAELVVIAVDSVGSLVNVIILDNGEYSEVPIGKIWIKNTAGYLTGVNPDFGVGKLEILSAGLGYKQTDTGISFAGSEILDDWQTEYSPILPVALITPEFSNTIINNSELIVTQILDGAIWQVGDIIWSVEGIFWQGYTQFESEYTTWDGNTTQFQETLEPKETIFDQTYNTYERYGTTFDVPLSPARDARANWGLTGFDEFTTAFEFYSTIFDAARPPRESNTIIKRIVTLQMPEWSGNVTTGQGNNVVDWSTVVR